MNKILNNVVGGRYYVLEQIGKGGNSRVYRVKDVYTGNYYALKEYITSDPANQKNLLEGMEQELNVLRHTSHPVLPKIFNLIKEDERFYLIMELVEGINLKDYVKKNKRLKTEFLCDVMIQVCSGLYYLHSLEPPIIYRDLKPANIILQDNGRVKLIDFGIAKRYRNDIDMDEIAIGSKGFAAPEQFGKDENIGLFNTDIRTDIYGIGTTMFYLKTGKVYQGKFPLFFSQRIKKIIRKCTRKNPKDRYQNCIEVICRIKFLHNKIK